MILREDVSFIIEDDGGLLYAVEKTANGRLTAKVRVYGCVSIDGVEYEYDAATVRVYGCVSIDGVEYEYDAATVRVALKKSNKRKQS